MFNQYPTKDIIFIKFDRKFDIKAKFVPDRPPINSSNELNFLFRYRKKNFYVYANSRIHIFDSNFKQIEILKTLSEIISMAISDTTIAYCSNNLIFFYNLNDKTEKEYNIKPNLNYIGKYLFFLGSYFYIAKIHGFEKETPIGSKKQEQLLVFDENGVKIDEEVRLSETWSQNFDYDHCDFLPRFSSIILENRKTKNDLQKYYSYYLMCPWKNFILKFQNHLKYSN
jgi:hypothetical protein